MWDIGCNVSCILGKRREVEVKFLRVARRRVLSVIWRRTSNHVGGHRNKEAHVAKAKTITERICGCLVTFIACILCYR